MSDFNDTVRVSDLPMLTEGDNWKKMTTLGVDGDGRSVQVPLGAVMETVYEDHNTTAETGRRVSALAGQLCPPLRLTMDRKGVEVALGGAAEDTGVSLPDRFTVRLSHKPCERNAGKQQRLEYSTDGGKSWNTFEPTGDLTLSPEDQATMESLLAAIAADGYAEMEGRHGTHRFESEEDVTEYFEPRRNERVDIEVAADGYLLLRGKCQTLEGFNITTLPAHGRRIEKNAMEAYVKSLDVLRQAISNGKPFWMVFASKKGGNGTPYPDADFGSQQEAEAYCDKTGDRTWIVTNESEFEAMWDEWREDYEIDVPFVCDGGILCLMDYETPDPEAAKEVPFAFASLFEKSTVAVGPELPAVLGEGTWAKLYRDCGYLREVSAGWSIGDWVRMARSGIGKTFPTYKWLDGDFKDTDGDAVLRLRWEEAAPMLLDEVVAMSGREKASLTAGLFAKPIDTGDVLGKRMDEVEMAMGEMYEGFRDLYSQYGRMPRVMNFTVPTVLYDPATDVLMWHWDSQAFGFGFGGSQTVNIQELRFLAYLKDSLKPAPISSNVQSGSAGGYSNQIGNVKRIVVVGIGTLIEDGQPVVSEPHLVWDEGLHTKEEIMSWVGAVFHYKGHKATVADLPAKDNEVGDTWNVRSTGANYAWDGQEWDKLSETVDLSGVVMTADLSQVATSGSYNDLADKPTIPAAQEQADWNQSDPAAADYIKNKPTIPAAGSQVHKVTAAELTAAQTGGTLTEGDWYFVTDAGSRSLSLGLDATTAQTIWTEQV